jgi:Domain of unknown function (DUF4136)
VKLVTLTVFVCLSISASAQEVHFDYSHSTNFNSYKTYQWVDSKPVDVADQLLDQDIKRAVDEQLAGKGLRRVDTGGDLLVGYQRSLSQEKEFDSFGSGRLWGGTRITSSTIKVGSLVIILFDPSTRQLVWRGSAAKTLDIKKDPDKNYRNLEKAMAKLFRNYPPGLPRG